MDDGHTSGVASITFMSQETAAASHSAQTKPLPSHACPGVPGGRGFGVRSAEGWE